MTFNTLIGFIYPLIIFAFGIILRFSNSVGLLTHRNKWLFFVLTGLLLFAYKVYKYLM